MVFGVGCGNISVDIELRTEENFAVMLISALVYGLSMWLSLFSMYVYILKTKRCVLALIC